MRHSYGPNWYAATMGTGIVAVVLPGLPFHVPGAVPVALVFWLAASLLLVATGAAMLLGLREDPSLLRRHYDDPVMSHFYGAPAMALMTVGAGSIGVAQDLLGSTVAVPLAAVLWTAGTVLGLWTAIAVPYRAITRHEVADDSATGGWLMPVVPPMVSATTGAALVPHLAPGQARETLLIVCYALFGLTMIAGFLVLNQLWQRMVRHGALAPAAVPTVWIVLGFLGQSTTAVHHLGALAPSVVPGYGHALGMLAVCYGVPVWGFTVLWTALALTLTMRQLRDGLPVAPTWWSFTFPIGTVATGSSALAAATGLVLFEVAAGLAALGLLVGWVAAAYATWRLSARVALAWPAPRPAANR
ncbi:tellurite resistance protein TehA-like permease [Nocardioides albertanoniae]|uniref:Tellurite resistance protein TehA-like permease n=1 Tax=Nocardioides albertanoniae TaxID=1175486 RepID=A0A543A1E5_9ACTN|nr:TDT family transporter [Nocardioides albertanoniae]TQL66407.1 tellurite resistance protein TehA-like permease [Nocardioides albertanoniae]